MANTLTLQLLKLAVFVGLLYLWLVHFMLHTVLHYFRRYLELPLRPSTVVTTPPFRVQADRIAAGGRPGDTTQTIIVVPTLTLFLLNTLIPGLITLAVVVNVAPLVLTLP